MRIHHRIFQLGTPYVPRFIREFVRRHIPLREYDLARRRATNPVFDVRTGDFQDSPYLLGIVEEISQYHRHYVAACREMGISFRVIDLLACDWQQQVKESGCAAFLVWPSSCDFTIKGTFDYRLRLLEDSLGCQMFPTWQECWLTEHKPRLRDWMDAHDVPHPRTWVFHNEASARAFIKSAEYPIVCKTATGASGSGVRVIRRPAELRRVIRQAFGRGLCPRGFDPRDRQRGFIFLQEYLPSVEEWRMVRVGESFFGYRKERGPSGLHSASHTWSWLDPGPDLLGLLKTVTDLGRFASMDVDVLRTTDGRLFVNEMQTVFGCSTPAEQMKIDGVEGRYVWVEGGWQFEPGAFSQNHMCNLRIEHLLKRLNGSVPW